MEASLRFREARPKFSPSWIAYEVNVGFGCNDVLAICEQLRGLDYRSDLIDVTDTSMSTQGTRL